MNPTKSQIDQARAMIPASGEFKLHSLRPAIAPDAAVKRAGDPDDIPQHLLDQRVKDDAEVVAELAAREARDEALLAGQIEWLGMGRYRVK